MKLSPSEVFHKRLVLGAGVTIYLGDCLDILPHLSGIDAVISDPPYGMSYETRSKKWPGQKPKQKDGNRWGKAWNPIEGDNSPFDPSPWIVFPVWVLWGAQWFCGDLPTGKTWLVWDKGAPKTWSGADCEIAATNFGNGGVRMWGCLWQGFNRDREIREHHHPTQKPIDLMAWSMEQAKVGEGKTVVDPYMGSGTTGVACIRTGRNFIGIEKDPDHFETARERLQAELDQGDLFRVENSQARASERSED